MAKTGALSFHSLLLIKIPQRHARTQRNLSICYLFGEQRRVEPIADRAEAEGHKIKNSNLYIRKV